MMRSTERILVSHAGSLPSPDDLRKLIFARFEKEPYDAALLERRLRDEVKAAVRKQVECGVDGVNDGELSKTNFTHYVQERLGGIETRWLKEGTGPKTLSIVARELTRFPDYFKGGRGFSPYSRMAGHLPHNFCTGPLTYAGHAELKQDIANFKAALEGVKVSEAFLPANTPGTIEHWLHNEHYQSAEEFLFAIADVMRVEYKAITDAGLVVQIDDPDLPDGWQMFPGMSVDEYRKYAALRVDALNHALEGIPREQIRLHVCWGSFHGPHLFDIPLAQIADLIFRVRAGTYSIEASNPRHEHEYHVFETVKLPKDSVVMPGVIGHATDFIEHPELIAERLMRYAKLVGRENVVAGTDCGLGPRVGHPNIVWAKLEAMAEGARIATKRLWGR
jgi:5-methyltetrahydropteroyltriglutamate--homocysteine methyltransferase